MDVNKAPDRHVVRLTQGDDVLIKAWLPETWSFNLTNNWAPAFAETIQSRIDSSNIARTITSIGALGGITPRFQAATTLIWEGSTAVEFDLPLKIHSTYSSREQILEPLKNLIQAGTPSLAGNAFVAPSSAFARAFSADLGGAFSRFMDRESSRIDLHIGTYMCVQDVVIHDIQFTGHAMQDWEGHPMKADFQLRVSTAYTPSRDDILKWFIRS